MLEAEGVAEGVGEPGDLSASWCCPDGERVVVIHAGEAGEGNSGGGEFADGGLDVFRLQAHGKRERTRKTNSERNG